MCRARRASLAPRASAVTQDCQELMASPDKRAPRETRATRENPVLWASAGVRVTRATRASKACPGWTRHARSGPTAYRCLAAAGDLPRRPCCSGCVAGSTSTTTCRRFDAAATPKPRDRQAPVLQPLCSRHDARQTY